MCCHNSNTGRYVKHKKFLQNTRTSKKKLAYMLSPILNWASALHSQTWRTLVIFSTPS